MKIIMPGNRWFIFDIQSRKMKTGKLDKIWASLI